MEKEKDKRKKVVKQQTKFQKWNIKIDGGPSLN
jgi:hypothetical protein